MSKIMNAEKWLNHNDGIVNGELRVDPILACEEYHKYRKSVERCGGCKFFGGTFERKGLERGLCTYEYMQDKMSTDSCHNWQEREG